MLLMWKIRVLNRTTKKFGDRYLYTNTSTLSAIDRAAIEMVAENRSRNSDREIIKYRNLFIEGKLEELGWDPRDFERFSTVGPVHYFEDETGAELTHDEIAQILTGSSTARSIPSGARQHDIDLILAEPKPVPLSEVTLTEPEIRILGYFVRDLNELANSSFMKNRPGSLRSSGSDQSITTAASSEEIRSFVTIFRRLYMVNEPANFAKAVSTFAAAMKGHPYGNWVEASAKHFEDNLAKPPDAPPFLSTGNLTFSAKRLIDVFLYTQYAHQPDQGRQRQYGQCLSETGGNSAVLTWLFLTEIWKRTLEICNAGKVIAWWFSAYCRHHGILPDVLTSLHESHAGIGADEKEDVLQTRLFEEKVTQLAAEMWHDAGRPDGGPVQFLPKAREILRKRLSDE